MAPSNVWMALRWFPSFHSSLACSIVADLSLSWAAWRTASNAWLVELALRASRAPVSHTAAMSESSKADLVKGVSYQLNSINAAKLTRVPSSPFLAQEYTVCLKDNLLIFQGGDLKPPSKRRGCHTQKKLRPRYILPR